MSRLFTPRRHPTIKGYEEIVSGVHISRKSTIDHAGGFIPSLNFSRPGNIPNGVANLLGPITINGQTVEPEWRYNGSEGTLTTFPNDGYGVDLSITGAGNDVIPDQGSPLLGSVDGSILYDGGKSHIAGASSDYDVATEDIVLEILLKYGPSDFKYTFAKWATGFGYGVLQYNQSRIDFVAVGAGSTAETLTAALDLTVDVWFLLTFFFDASGFAQWYIGNVASGAAVDVSGVGSMTNSDLFLLGSRVGQPTSLYDSNIALAQLYKKSNWLASHLNQSFVNERFATLIGTKALSSRGSSIPTVATRASSAYLQKDTNGITELFQVGRNWIRLERVADLVGVEKVCFNTEPSNTNIINYNEDMTNWTWVGVQSVDADNASHPAPVDGKYYDGVIGTNAIAETFVYLVPNSINPTAVRHVFVARCKPGAIGWVALRITSASLGNVLAYFDITNGNPGTVSLGSADIGIMRLNTGEYKIYMSPTSALYAEATSLYLYSAESDLDTVFQSDGVTVDTWWFGAELKPGTVPDSYIGPTTTSAVARAADTLEYKLDDGALENGQGAVQFDILIPNATPVTAIPILTLSDGGSALDRFIFEVATDGTIKCTMDATGGTQRIATVAGNCADGKWHSIHMQFQEGQFVIRRDGVAGTVIEPVAADIPNDIDRLSYGNARVGNFQSWLQPYFPGV
jgi:hypothetical protein